MIQNFKGAKINTGGAGGTGRSEYYKLRDQGVAQFEQSQFQSAQQYLTQAHTHALKHFGQNDPDTIEASKNVATVRARV